MLPAMYQHDNAVLLLYENKAKLIDAKNGFSIRSESLFPDNILKATQNSNVVIVTTKNEKYMIDFLSGEVRLANGTVFFEARPQRSGACLYAQVSGSASAEKISESNLSKESKYGEITISDMMGACIAAEDARLMSYSDWDIFFWRPVNPLPAIFPDWEVFKKVESTGPIKRATLDDEGNNVVILTNNGILSVLSFDSNPENRIITDTCCDFALVNKKLVFAEWTQLLVFDMEQQKIIDPFEH